MLGRESIVAVERTGTEPGTKQIAIHSYVQIESCDLLPSYRDTKHLGDFGIQLNFYQKKLDAAKKQVMIYECREKVIDSEEERKVECAVEEHHPDRRQE